MTVMGQSQASSLVAQLDDFKQAQDITPDLFFQHIATLRAAISQQTQPGPRAVYQATLAHILARNADRANEYWHDTPSPIDSLQEWSNMEYQQHAARLYAQALADPMALHRMPSTQWIPLVTRGRNLDNCTDDMLMVVWRAMVQDIEPRLREECGMPTTDEMCQFYIHNGTRDDQLYLQLLDVDRMNATAARDELMKLRLHHNYLAVGAEVYLRLADHTMTYAGMTDEERLAWADMALEKWPDSRWKNNLENQRRQITAPLINAAVPKVAYPLVKTPIALSLRNLRDITLYTYKLPLDFEKRYKADGESTSREQLLQLVRKHGVKLNESTLTPRKSGSKARTYEDTVNWHTPDCGLYAWVATASPDAPVSNKPTPMVSLVRVSRLACYQREMPDGQTRISVVDWKTGEPQQGAMVNLYIHDNETNTDTPLTEQTTGSEGTLLVTLPKDKPIYIKVSRAGDEAMRPTELRPSRYFSAKEKLESRRLLISTDRSIYRPGQQILMSAVAYKEQGWDSQVLPGEEYDVTLRDANGQQVCLHRTRTDSMGVLKDTLSLPESGLPGSYTIIVGRDQRGVQVEEYVRPTFEVKLKQPETSTAHHDTVTITGLVTTYSGMPVSGARITGRATWTNPWWWRNHVDDTRCPLDTLRTDGEGRFTYRLAVMGTPEQRKRGRTLEVQVDALAPQGETQTGTLRMTVCDSPLRMTAQVPEQQCKEYPEAWLVSLYSSTDQAVQGNVTCTLSRKGEECKTLTLAAGKRVKPQELASLESGCYDVLVRANIDGDTASWSGHFELTSITDTVLHHKEQLYLHSPQPYMASGQPAVVQIGTTLSDAWVRLTVESEAGMTTDTLLHLSNSLDTWAFYYKQEYNQGLTVSATLWHDGQLEQESQVLKAVMPSDTLHMRWLSFRDHLRPGQKEEWRLSVLRPDGTPARANITATLYDASLDALCGHSMRFAKHRAYMVPHAFVRGCSPSRTDRHHVSQVFTTRTLKEYHRVFPTFDNRYDLTSNFAVYESVTTGARRGKAHYTRSMRLQGMGNAMAKMSNDILEAVPLAGSIAGLETEAQMADTGSAEEVETDDEMAIDDPVNLRVNLLETAFYVPDLRTNSQGEAQLCFTLPESMTSWHLLGMAHTSDMMMGFLDTLVVAEKELMAELHLPRFLRDGDQGMLIASLRNRTDMPQRGKATLTVLDAATERVLMRQTVRFDLIAQADTTLRFPYTATTKHTALAVKWVAEGKEHTDGEQRYLPVLTDLQNMTETKAFSLSTPGHHSIDLSKLFDYGNEQATGRSLTVEYTSDPKWLALQTLPSLAAPTSKDVLSLASAYYAGTLAYSIGQRYPQVRQAVEEWNSKDTAALESPLVKNQSLCNTFLQETPWVMEAAQERARRQRLTTLMDDVKQEDYRMGLLMALKHLQRNDGSFAWYPGMQGSDYLTREVACRLARLYAMTGNEMPQQREMREKACRYLLRALAIEVKQMKKTDKPVLSHGALRTLYALRLSDYNSQLTANERQTVNYLLDLLKKQAAQTDREERALAAVVLHLYGEEKQAAALMERLHALLSQPDGMHLAYRSGAGTSIDRKTAEHVQMMEAVRMVQPSDTVTLSKMQEWLIGMKRTQEWNDAAQTADAVYALLNAGSDTHQGADALTLRTAGQTHAIKCPDTMLGYVRERIEAPKSPKTLEVDKQEGGVSFGAVYAQYQIPAREAGVQREGLSIRRDIDQVDNLHEGSRVHVRYTLTADRDYEFVRLMSPRPAAAEPSAQISDYRMSGRLGHYQAIHDASTEYFIDHLPRGTYVVEEDWLISREGCYTLPPACLQCLYAPDFQAHTTGTSVTVREKVERKAE